MNIIFKGQRGRSSINCISFKTVQEPLFILFLLLVVWCCLSYKSEESELKVPSWRSVVGLLSFFGCFRWSLMLLLLCDNPEMLVCSHCTCLLIYSDHPRVLGRKLVTFSNIFDVNHDYETVREFQGFHHSQSRPVWWFYCLCSVNQQEFERLFYLSSYKVVDLIVSCLDNNYYWWQWGANMNYSINVKLDVVSRLTLQWLRWCLVDGKIPPLVFVTYICSVIV